MEEYGHVKLGGGLPERAQARVREREERAVGQADGQPERLEDLEPAGAGRDRGLELPGEPVAEVRVLDEPPVRVGECDEAAGPGPIVAVEVELEDVAPPTVEVEYGAQIQLVHHLDKPRHVLDGPAGGSRVALGVGPAAQAEVVVGVDRGQTGAVRRVVGSDERRHGEEVGERKGLVGGRRRQAVLLVSRFGGIGDTPPRSESGVAPSRAAL